MKVKPSEDFQDEIKMKSFAIEKANEEIEKKNEIFSV
jgi:hypothetical protein